MAAKLFQRLRVKNPAELAQKAHQAFVRLPYESSQDRVVEELSRLMSGIKVREVAVSCWGAAAPNRGHPGCCLPADAGHGGCGL